MNDWELPEGLADLPPSAELIYRLVLELDEPTHGDLLEETARSPRTVRYALRRLLEAGLVTKRPSTTDARQEIYEIATPDSDTSG